MTDRITVTRVGDGSFAIQPQSNDPGVVPLILASGDELTTVICAVFGINGELVAVSSPAAPTVRRRRKAEADE